MSDDKSLERARLLLDAAGLSQQSFDGRRTLEWKLAFGQWTAVGIFTWFAVSLSEFATSMWIVIPVFVVVFIYGVSWNLALQISHRLDKDWKHYYLHEFANLVVRDDLTTDGPKRPSRSQTRSWKQWYDDHASPAFRTSWLWGHILISLAMLYGSGALICSANSAKEKQREQTSLLRELNATAKFVQEVGSVERATRALDSYHKAAGN